MKQLVRLFVVLAASTSFASAQLNIVDPDEGEPTTSDLMNAWVMFNDHPDYDPGPWGDDNVRNPMNDNDITPFIQTVMEFQVRNGLPATRKADATTRQALQNAAGAGGGSGRAAGSATASEAAMVGSDSAEDCIGAQAGATAGAANEVRSKSRTFGRLLRRISGDNAISDATDDVASVSGSVAGGASDVRSLAGNCNQ